MPDDQSPLRMNYRTARILGLLVFGAGLLIVSLYLFTLIPGSDRILPTLSSTILVVGTAAVGIIAATLCLSLAPTGARVIRAAIDGSQTVTTGIASIIHWGFVLAAVIALHWGFTPLVTAVIPSMLWVHDLLFFLLAVPPFGFIVARGIVLVSPAVDLFAARIANT